MSGQVANSFFFIKKKDWRSKTLANPPPPTSDSISFLVYHSLHPLRPIASHFWFTTPPPPTPPHTPAKPFISQSGRHRCINP